MSCLVDIYVVYNGKLLYIWDIWSVFGYPFLHKLVYPLRYKWNDFLNVLTFNRCTQKYNSYTYFVKNESFIFECCTRAFCCIIFYSVLPDNVNNLYKSILLIISFLFFSVEKELVGTNEKNLE